MESHLDRPGPDKRAPTEPSHRTALTWPPFGTENLRPSQISRAKPHSSNKACAKKPLISFPISELLYSIFHLSFQLSDLPRIFHLRTPAFYLLSPAFSFL